MPSRLKESQPWYPHTNVMIKMKVLIALKGEDLRRGKMKKLVYKNKLAEML